MILEVAGFFCTDEPTEAAAVTSDGGACSSDDGDWGATTLLVPTGVLGRAASLSSLTSARALTRPLIASTAAASAFWSFWIEETAASSFSRRAEVSDIILEGVGGMRWVILLFVVKVLDCGKRLIVAWLRLEGVVIERMGGRRDKPSKHSTAGLRT